MTVMELIEELEKHPKDMRVVTPGYEYGLDDIYNLEEMPINLNVNTEWYLGPHEEYDRHNASKADEIALIIHRGGFNNDDRG